MSASIQKVADPANLVGKVTSAIGIGGKPAAAPAAVASSPAPVLAAKPDVDPNAAIAERNARGRASTLAAGQDETDAAQMQRGLLKSKQRNGGAASRTLLG